MKRKTILISILFVALIIIVSGCGKSKPSQKKILEDLRLQKEVTEWNDLVFDITDCEIIACSSAIETECIYNCKLVKMNDRFEIIANCTVKYSYVESIGWNFSNYEEDDIVVTPLSGMDDETVTKGISINYAYLDDKNIAVSNIKHNFNKESKTDIVVADYTYSPKWYTKSGTVTLNAEFKNNSWQIISHSEDNAQMTWNLSELVGIWQITCPGDNYTVEFKITNVNQSNNTVIMQCRHAPTGFIAGGQNGSDLIKSEKYTSPEEYTLKFNEDQNGPYVFIGFYRFSDGWFDTEYDLYANANGVYVPHLYNNYFATKVEDSNNVNTKTSDLRNELRIGWSEFKPLNYYNGQNELVGFDTELAKYVCEYYGWKPIFVEIPFDASFASIQNGTIDCYWSGMAKNEERMKVSDFTDVYLSTYIDGEYEDFSVPCTKGDSELVNKINKALQAARENGTIQDLKIKYGLK